MKISYNWLKDYVEIDKSPDELADDLSMFGHQAESIQKLGNDSVLDLEITANRGDCLSILGIAREIAALYDIKLQIPHYEVKTKKIDKQIEVKIEKPEICPRFTARIIDNVKISESAKEIQERLATYGFRPVNNIVDITNFVMVATGQPLHAFDYDKIKDGLMSVRQAKAGEEVMTLDGQNRVLKDGAVIIEDNEKIYDLAGIMGGFKSEVDEKTKTIILQGAVFDQILIRRTSKALNHITDASYRYERGVDFEGTIVGVDMASAMIQEACPEAKIGELIDKKMVNTNKTEIEFELAKINQLIGVEVDSSKARNYLERLNFKLQGSRATVPSYRAYDVKIWQDLAEEIARMHGYNKINKVHISKLKSQSRNLEFLKREYIKDLLKEIGFTEVYSYSFAEKDRIELLGGKISDCVEIANPLSPETQYLRPSLLPSLFAAAAKNPWAPEVNIFEIEKVFDKSEEKWQLGLVTSGKNADLLNKALEKLEIRKEPIMVAQTVLDRYKIRRPINYLLTDLEEIKIEAKNYSSALSQNKYRPISRLAPTVRDLAFLVAQDVNSEDVKGNILSVSPKILLVELFDEFTSDKFGPGQKNLAFHVWLEEAQAEDVFEQINSKIEKDFGAKLRSK